MKTLRLILLAAVLLGTVRADPARPRPHECAPYAEACRACRDCSRCKYCRGPGNTAECSVKRGLR